MSDNESKPTPQNIILYGPPGTGKTYSTTERALELILGKNKPKNLKSEFRKYEKKGQIEFVTFHQSYGYEEFVEGLRPVLNEDEGNDVRYELHDGVFKRIARRAAFDFLWDQLVAKIEETDEYIVKSKGLGKHKGNPYKLSLAPNSDTIHARNIDDPDTNLQATRNSSEELWKNCKKDPKDLKTNAISVPGNPTSLWIVYKCLWELSRSPDMVKKALGSKQYVLIIDEINRGNMSKILGELITLLEPDKRLGEDNELILKLPYSQEDFGVPPNLHILGTMNTADRSIALMDVALRRRFKFAELMPDAGVINGEEPLGKLVVDLFETLNKRIRFLYDRDHQLGHSYFLNVNSLEELRGVFVDRVIPLLQEYFYGDWHKICIVLGCPYSENGEQKNDLPIVKADLFGEVDTLGFDHDEYEDRVDCAVSPDFLEDEITDENLVSAFLGVLPDKLDKSEDRLKELIRDGSSSNKKDDEADSGDDQ